MFQYKDWYFPLDPEQDKRTRDYLDSNQFGIEALHLALEYLPEENRRVAIDCGANIGYWSVEMIKHFHKVYSFELAPSTFECLVENTKQYPAIHCFNRAIGNKNTEVGIGNERKISAISNRVIHDLSSSETVSEITLDSLGLKNIDLIKLDMCGYEYFGIQGALALIDRYKPLIISEVSRHLAEYNITKQQFLKLMAKLGYKVVENFKSTHIFKHVR